MRDTNWYEREYNPQPAPDEDVSLGWAARAESMRTRYAHLADIPLGDHPRECCDLFRAENSKGVVFFIHGGYWHVSSKDDMSWITEYFVKEGYSVALLNYPLCPEVTIGSMVESVRRSFAKFYSSVLGVEERNAIVVTGHSAGGYLAASLIATNWSLYGLPRNPFQSAVIVSGLFDLSPLVHVSHNRYLRLTDESARSLSLVHVRPAMQLRLAFVVGQRESYAFHEQTARMAESWRELNPKILTVSGVDHYQIMEEFAKTGTELHSLIENSIT